MGKVVFKDGKRSYLDNEKKLQITKDIYRIRTVTDDKGEDGKTITSIYAEAAFYDLAYSEKKSEQTYEAETAEKPMAYALQGTGWSVGKITVSTKRSWQSTDKNALSMLRTIQSIYGGDLEFDNVNKQVSLLTQSGSNSGAVFAYRKNMKSIQRVVDTRSLVTRLYAYGADGMTFASINNGKEYVENTEYSSEIRVSTLDCSSFTNPYQMLEYTEMRLADYSKPSISYVIQVMDLSVLTGWEHESFGIGDVVTVDDKDLGIRISTRIIRMDYNVQEPWKTVIELSTKLKELGDSSASWEKAADLFPHRICLNYVRELKDLGIGIIFEKENINTLDAKGEVLLTILSSLAQDESRSISENCTWGIRRRFETGKHKMSTKRFLGYDTDETGKLVINRTQEPIVIRLYQEFLDGKTTDYIKRIFKREGVKNWDGGTKWQSTTLMSMLENEKYKGDALLQKSYTVDFLTKKRTQNKGEIQMFYVEDDHDAIISKRIWECVQLEIKRRKKYLEEHGTNSYSHRPESNPFASKIICGDCNKVFARKGWRSSTGVDRKVWQCSERYKVKGVMGCANRHVEEETLIKAYLMAWNALVENREDFMEQWTEQLQSENLLESYRAEKFIEYTDGAKPLTEMDTDFMLKTLDHIKVFEDGTLLVVFLDGTEIEWKNEEE